MLEEGRCKGKFCSCSLNCIRELYYFICSNNIKNSDSRAILFDHDVNSGSYFLVGVSLNIVRNSFLALRLNQGTTLMPNLSIITFAMSSG